MKDRNSDKILALARERIAERQAAEHAAKQLALVNERPWQFIFLGLLTALLLTFFFWPGYALDWKLYATVHGLVAQKHNVSLGGNELPVCARNLGIYSSFVLSVAYLFARGRGRAAAFPPRPIVLLLGLFVLSMAFDGVNSLLEDTGRTYLYEPRNDLRTITGVLFGIAMTSIIMVIFNQSLRADAERESPILTWDDLGGLLLLNALFVGVAHSNMGFFYWPLAFFSVGSLVAELFVVFTMAIATAMGYMGRITSLTQLARPACLGLGITVLFVGGLAALRFATGEAI
ncbi:DUF2085 domain-containing protein [Candidatus Viridilinea mediisalina]|uniref:DUF2085 domain-containing protein n=1 Tax=Candidatus Viridilinea mediisalina TaxID=2024553 RepID=A0A2A6RLZ2_9CHLR|nr:DUF2085 domain-containing protein [Candidatus Viridilinea mediisalina]PDW03945.1 hypothetical protein CJ255_06210 [Candidatus Viridilinea mediisalina]